jgi:Putative addiction module component
MASRDRIRGSMLPLDKMTTSEKLREMERRWDDLYRHPENVPSPSRHEAILAGRERLIAEGKMSFVDLDEARRRIRDATR